MLRKSCHEILLLYISRLSCKTDTENICFVHDVVNILLVLFQCNFCTFEYGFVETTLGLMLHVLWVTGFFFRHGNNISIFHCKYSTPWPADVIVKTNNIFQSVKIYHWFFKDLTTNEKVRIDSRLFFDSENRIYTMYMLSLISSTRKKFALRNHMVDSRRYR